MGPALWDELPEVFQALDSDPEIRAILLRGSGQNFSYGLDLKSMLPVLGAHLIGPKMAQPRQQLLALIHRLQGSISAVAACRKPVIAAIEGWCIGGGLDLAAACDFRLCSADARFSLREVKLAIVADLGSLQRLPAIIGQGHTRELAMTGKNISAQRALQIGLVNHVYPDVEALLVAARETVQEIADNSAVTVQGFKEILDYCADKSIDDGLRYVAVWNSAFLQSVDLIKALSST